MYDGKYFAICIIIFRVYCTSKYPKRRRCNFFKKKIIMEASLDSAVLYRSGIFMVVLWVK